MSSDSNLDKAASDLAALGADLAAAQTDFANEDQALAAANAKNAYLTAQLAVANAEIAQLIANENEAVSISPTSATLAPGKTQQFIATVTGGSPDKTVAWAASGSGTIDTNGLYTAPSNVPTATTVTVIATSNADPSKSGSASITLTATAPPPPPPDTLANALMKLEAKTDWIQDGNSGDSGGSSGKVNGTFAMTPGSPALFSAKGNYPYNNGYWYRKMQSMAPKATKFRLALEVLFPSAADLAGCHCVEFECQQAANGWIYNFAWQANIGAKVWTYFDYVNRKWIPTTIALPTLAAQKWVTVLANFSIPKPGVTLHTDLTVDGVKNACNLTLPAKSGSGDYLSHAYQLDSDGKTPPTPYKTQVRNYNLSWE